MKQESEEKTLKELFRRLKREDERRAPSFAASMAAARSRLEARGKSSWPRRSLAVVAAILIASGFIVYRAIQNGPQKNNSVITEKAPTPRPSAEYKQEFVKENLEPRRGSRAPRPLRRHRPQISQSIITDSMPVYEKRGEYATDFIPLSYGGVQKPMESGEVVRLEMPRSALIAFGLPVNVEHADTPVKAELLLGEDGMARAIRFLR
jgi:hypothetical protein